MMHFRRMLSTARDLSRNQFHVTTLMAFTCNTVPVNLAPYGAREVLRLIAHMWQESPEYAQKFIKGPHQQREPGYLLYALPRTLFCSSELYKQYPDIMKYVHNMYSKPETMVKELNASEDASQKFITETKERFGLWHSVMPLQDIPQRTIEKKYYTDYLAELMAEVGLPALCINPDAPPELRKRLYTSMPIQFLSPDSSEEDMREYEASLYEFFNNDVLVEQACAKLLRKTKNPKPFS